MLSCRGNLGLMKPFEIFRTGRHTSSQGDTLSFSDTDLSAIAGSYDTLLHHAPIVVGHPKQDAPAYGWVDALEVVGDRLVARPANVDAAFSDLVREKKFRKVSAAFYPPNAANNPTPGSYYLRHVGFLGAAAPAVKGLKPVEFEDGEVVIEFGEIEFSEWRQAWAFDAAARMFRRLRDWMIETSGVEAADKAVPAWDVDQLAQAAADLRAEEALKEKPAFAEPHAEPETTEGNDMETAAELQARADALAAQEAAFAEKERKARDAEDASFVDGIVQAGRLPIGLQATATALFADLGEEELTFADGDETRKMTPRAAFRDLLEKLPVPVVTDELARGDAVDFSDVEQISAAINDEIKAASDKGEKISSAEAAMRLKNRSK